MPNEPSMGQLVNRTARLFRRLADQRLEPLGLSAGHLPVLTALMQADALSQKALVEHAGIEQPTMAATLTRMEREGVVERRPDPDDGRGFLFSLAPKTRKKVPAIKAAVSGIGDDALAGLSADERRLARRLLGHMIAALEKASAE